MKKAEKALIFGIFLLTFALYCTTDIYIAFAPSLIHQLKTDERWLKFTFLIGPVVALSLSHSIGFWFKRFSYRFLYPFMVFVFCVGCWISGHSQMMSHFVFGRIIQAFSLTGMGIINSSLLASILDGQKEKLGAVFQYYSGVFAVIFLVSPFLGSVIHSKLGFDWCFFIPGLISLFSLGLIVLNIPKSVSETMNSKQLRSSSFKMNLFDKDLFCAAFPTSVSFVFSVHAPFYLSQLGYLSAHAIAVIQVLPLLCQLLASSTKKSFGIWPFFSGVCALFCVTASPEFLKPILVVFAFCLFPFFLVPLMARATASYLQVKSKLEASAHLNFCRNLFISISMLVYLLNT